MGRKNYRFKLSDMIPNSWFYKLRDMGTTRNRIHATSKLRHPSSLSSSSSSSSSSIKFRQPHNLSSSSDHRKSYHINRGAANNSPVINPPPSRSPPPARKSASRRRRSLKRYRPQQTTKRVSTTVTASGCSCHARQTESVWPDESNNFSLHTTNSSSDCDSVTPECGSDTIDVDDFDDDVSCKCMPRNDIVIEIADKDNNANNLPPIITNGACGSLSVKVVKEEVVSWTPTKTGVKRVSVNSSSSPGVRLRTNSPRILNRRGGRKSTSSNNSIVSDSFAVVKSSKNPRRDFRESMVEMIVENNIRASKDLEELLACYLSLNADEYHDMIINVFKQIWFDFIDK